MLVAAEYEAFDSPGIAPVVEARGRPVFPVITFVGMCLLKVALKAGMDRGFSDSVTNRSVLKECSSHL
jgi:hypothetical protein